MSPDHQKRRAAILERTEALLPSRGYGAGHNFILSRDEALEIGDAVASRNAKKLRDTLAEAVLQLEDHYDSLPVEDLKSDWDAELQRITGEDVQLTDFLVDETRRAQLNGFIEADALNLAPITYIKLLETLIYADAPLGIDTFKLSHAESRRQRRPGSKSSHLYARCLSKLNDICSNEPGIRKIREGLLDNDETALDTYLASYSRSRVAQKAYADIIETFCNGNVDLKREDVLMQLRDANGFDELLKTHILNWELLPVDILARNPNERNKIIKTHLEDQAPDGRRKDIIADNWRDERINVLFDTADLASHNGRRADIYISNTFDGGCGVYLAAVLAHPLNPDESVVVADNPIHGNALYTVDEQLTEVDPESNKPYTWKQVLGQHRRVARALGARRRYHTGDWSQVPKAICEYGGNYQLAREKEQQRQMPVAGSESAAELSFEQIRAQLLATIQRSEEISAQLNRE